ncbi:MAG: hybrid sensor histidine kinase/response regulator [Aggregatilineales bacterium]
MPNGTILVVDDADNNRSLLHSLLSHQGYTVLQAGDGLAALAILEKEAPDLVLLDVQMPHMDGFETCQRIKANPRTRSVPVIFISASDEVKDKIYAFTVGAIDYVTKPLHAKEVVARVNTHVSLYQQQRELDALRATQINQLKALDEAKSRFVRSISHDLKNPLGLILSATDVLRETQLSDTQAQLVGIIEHKAHFMLSIISNLLDLARLTAGVPPNHMPTSLRTLIQESLVGFDLQAESKQLAFSVSLPEEDALVEVERHAICRMIGNLVSNAIKYTSKGGIDVRVEVAPEAFSIAVSDSGLGIPPEALPYIFDKFYRIPLAEYRKEDGTGLGLAIVKAIVEQHQGTIDVETAVGVGSTFRVTLPRQPKRGRNHHKGSNSST